MTYQDNTLLMIPPINANMNTKKEDSNNTITYRPQEKDLLIVKQ